MCLLQQVVVVGMGADPEPDHVVIVADGNSPVAIVNSSRPITSDLFEMQ